MDKELFETGLKIRSEVLGKEYVENSLKSADEFNMPFQEFVTAYCWGGGWGRPGLTRKQRSMLNLAMIPILNRSARIEAAYPRRADQRRHQGRDPRDLHAGRHLRRHSGGGRRVPPGARGVCRAEEVTIPAVVPAKAGRDAELPSAPSAISYWMPAFAGMTRSGAINGQSRTHHGYRLHRSRQHGLSDGPPPRRGGAQAHRLRHQSGRWCRD